jgi:hypothetical protein
VTNDGWEHASITNTDQFAAQRILPVLEDFVEEFSTRNDLSKLSSILTTKSTRLSGEVAGQRPEWFTEQYLIKPCLEALGYTNIRGRPSEVAASNRSEPDYAMDGGYTDTTFIVEAKTFTDLATDISAPTENESPTSDASDQINGYLEENFLTKYSTELNEEYLVGVLTDGVYWVLFGKRIRAREIELLGSVSLAPVLKRVIRARRYPEQVGDRWRVEERNQLEERFTSTFLPDRVHNKAVSELGGQ